ncbi:TetR/AcrR family transcriptional regulator C-terminal ligand-binding domain-containing protein [Klebsiella variicola]
MIFEQAAQRGELDYKGQRKAILEMLIAPVWFRILITQKCVDEEYLITNIRDALAMKR